MRDLLRTRLALTAALALFLLACACVPAAGFEAHAVEGDGANGTPVAEASELGEDGEVVEGAGESSEGEAGAAGAEGEGSEGEAEVGQGEGAADEGAADEGAEGSEGEGSEGEGSEGEGSEGEGSDGEGSDGENEEGAGEGKPKGIIAQFIDDALQYASEVAADAESSEGYELEDLAELEADNVVDPTQRADNSFIYDSTIATIVEQSSLYNEKTVQVIGEVVGDRITDTLNSGRCWITLAAPEEGATTSVFVLLSDELASQIDHYGRYGVTGTMLQVRGTFNQACAEHDGQTDLHATDASVISRGVEHPDEFDLVSFYPGMLAVVVGLILFWAFNFARERTR